MRRPAASPPSRALHEGGHLVLTPAEQAFGQVCLLHRGDETERTAQGGKPCVAFRMCVIHGCCCEFTMGPTGAAVGWLDLRWFIFTICAIG
jgi:hypothetical protein